MTKKTKMGSSRHPDAGRKRGAVMRSAASERMSGIASIPTIERREYAVQLSIKRAE